MEPSAATASALLHEVSEARRLYVDSVVNPKINRCHGECSNAEITEWENDARATVAERAVAANHPSRLGKSQRQLVREAVVVALLVANMPTTRRNQQWVASSSLTHPRSW